MTTQPPTLLTDAQRAHDIAVEVLCDPKNPDRASGDCYAAALAAGVDPDAAHDIALAVHKDEALRERLISSGPALLGAEVALQRLQERAGADG